MKRVFRFKKEEYWDGDDPLNYFLHNYLTGETGRGAVPKCRKNWKITVIIEEEKVKK